MLMKLWEPKNFMIKKEELNGVEDEMMAFIEENSTADQPNSL